MQIETNEKEKNHPSKPGKKYQIPIIIICDIFTSYEVHIQLPDVYVFVIETYRISANSFRGNYSFLNLTLCTVTKGHSVTVHTGAETILGNTVLTNI